MELITPDGGIRSTDTGGAERIKTIKESAPQTDGRSIAVQPR